MKNISENRSSSEPRSSRICEDSPVFVAGHRGLVGSAIVRKLGSEGCRNLITRTHDELDLMDQKAVAEFFRKQRPEYVFLAAAKVGGINANNRYPAEFIYNNLLIQTNVIHQAYLHNVSRLLFLGSSCIYPRMAPQPLKEEYLMTGPLEPTNSPYAVAKIAGIEMCWSYNRQYGTRFIPVMPANLYGPDDNYDLETSHVLPALIRKFHLAKLATQDDLDGIEQDKDTYGPIPEDIRSNLADIIQAGSSSEKTNDSVIHLWGTGSPRREFLHVDDLADAAVFLMNRPWDSLEKAYGKGRSSLLFNVGAGEDLSIKELADLVSAVVGYKGSIAWDSTKPDGTPRKLLDVTKMESIGWKWRTTLEKGIKETYEKYLRNETGKIIA